MPRSIFLGNPGQISYVFSEEVKTALAEKAGLDPEKVYSKDEILTGVAKDTEYIFSTWGMPHFEKEEIAVNLPSLKAIFYAAGTVQGFAREFIESGVSVFSAWAANAVPVAEYTVAQIILANKGFFKLSLLNSKDLEGRNEARKAFSNYRGNYGASVGIIGAGMIGRLVIERLHDYNLNVKVYDPFLSDEKAKELKVEKCSLEELFSSCETVSNHVANNPQTVGMINGKLFELMKPYATFINTGRGAQVVESEMFDFLEKRPDVTAVLDVTNPEPPVEGSKMYSLENIILTPHIAGSAGDEVHRMAEYMLEEYSTFVLGAATRYSVTLKMLETMA